MSEASSPESEREEIAKAAEKWRNPWLDYMARFAEPDLTPAAWAEALAQARRS